MKSIKKIASVLMKAELSNSLRNKVKNITFPGSANYWEKRYRKNGNSGIGSFGRNASYKASVLNQFVADNNIQSVIEFGCGDGHQAGLFNFPFYIGLDVSPTAIKICKDIFNDDSTKQFFLYEGKTGDAFPHDFEPQLSLSLDVIYHLVEDEVYETYLHDLFDGSGKYVIIYAWDVEEKKKYHVRHRNFSKWIKDNITGFQLKERISNPNYCDFFIYEKVSKEA